ncbi:MAG: hypothetical protein JRF46_04410 [Deltaproteobacteria bacterium]|nr:hypothetical protein [Deltaproteobacteria bacterium]
MRILFNERGKPLEPKSIRKSIATFGSSYNRTVGAIIENSGSGINRKVFYQNVATLMPNFKMTRQGPFKGVNYFDGKAVDPKGQISVCWQEVGEKVIELRNFLDAKKKDRARVIIEIPHAEQEKVASELWQIFKKLVSLCMGKNTLGLVAASKVLFAVLPEVALPVDNTQWRAVFKTIDYGDIVRQMAAEMTEWEKRRKTKLDSCDPFRPTTLPSIYNVMAMRARP